MTHAYHAGWLAVVVAVLGLVGTARAGFVPDKQYLADREALEEVQRDAFLYMWEHADPSSGMVFEAIPSWEPAPLAVGGTGFGIAATVVAVDRGWITRNQAVNLLLRITGFLREKAEHDELHGAFPHWVDDGTGEGISFSPSDDGADLVETSLLMQGLLIARAYFNGPGVEARLRDEITEIWERIDWNWFTNGEENGLYWHWSPVHGFTGLKVLGYNECLITYLLAIASPTHGISRKAFDYWWSGENYGTRSVFGYDLQATMVGGGPLFLAHYSFIGLAPRRIADEHVTQGYFVRNVKQTLSNRGYCLQDAPPEYKYDFDFWGLTASTIPSGYAANDPLQDSGTVAPTAALCSMPYTPLYSLQVLRNLRNELRPKVWGENGPRDAINLRDDWVSDGYLAIDQLPIVSMIENYRSGLLWDLFMSDPDIIRGLEKAGLRPPELEQGFPEAVVTLKKENGIYVEDAHEIVRHPDTGKYAVPFWCDEEGPVSFTIAGQNGQTLFETETTARKGRNILSFEQFMQPEGKIVTLTMRVGEKEYALPLRLY